jgi:hypothetical protein
LVYSSFFGNWPFGIGLTPSRSADHDFIFCAVAIVCPVLLMAGISYFAEGRIGWSLGIGPIGAGCQYYNDLDIRL